MKNSIIDGTNLLHRTYHSSKGKEIRNTQGTDVGHVLYFLKAIKGFAETLRGDRMYIAWDSNDRSFTNFRQDGTDYKGHRNRDESDNVHKNDNLIKALCRCLGVINITSEKVEADDIIAWICLELYPEDENIIISSDQDFYQLVHFGKDVTVYSPLKDILVNEHNFEEHVDVDKKHFLLYKAVIGDTSDNIKGLYKYGPVKSRKFVKDFRTNFNNLGDDDKNIIKRNLKIMDLRAGYKYYDGEVEYYQTQNSEPAIFISMDKFFEVCETVELHSITNNKGEWKRAFRIDDSGVKMLSLVERLSK